MYRKPRFSIHVARSNLITQPCQVLTQRAAFILCAKQPPALQLGDQLVLHLHRRAHNRPVAACANPTTLKWVCELYCD